MVFGADLLAKSVIEPFSYAEMRPPSPKHLGAANLWFSMEVHNNHARVPGLHSAESESLVEYRSRVP